MSTFFSSYSLRLSDGSRGGLLCFDTFAELVSTLDLGFHCGCEPAFGSFTGLGFSNMFFGYLGERGGEAVHALFDVSGGFEV